MGSVLTVVILWQVLVAVTGIPPALGLLVVGGLALALVAYVTWEENQRRQ
jgi:hypothetical protein